LKFEIGKTSSSSYKFDCICGVPVTGLLLSAILSRDMSKPLVYVPKEPGHRLTGFVSPGSEVIIIEDVSETGKSIEYAVNSIRANGGVVSRAISIIDRLEGASEALQKMGVSLESFTTAQELADHLKENMALSEDEIALVESAGLQKSSD